MICKEYGGGPTAFEYLVTEADQAMTDIMYYAILRRYQLENLRQIDREEWPSKTLLIDYEYRGRRDTDYYRPHDLFIQLGEWLLQYRETERRKHYEMKQKQK